MLERQQEMKAKMKEVIQFWEEFEVKGHELAHPDDLPILRKKNVIHPAVKNMADLEAAIREYTLHPRKFHLGLLPQPYHGNIAESPIVLLLLNSGIHASDFYLEQMCRDFRDEMSSVISQDQKKDIFLDPKWARTGGFNWWERKLRDTGKEMVQRSGSSYGDALEWLSHNVSCLELVPYHSQSFDTVAGLPSSKAAIRAAQEIALNPNRKVIVTRGVRHWELKDQTNVVNYIDGEPRSASLGPRSKGGKAILEAFDICRLGRE